MRLLQQGVNVSIFGNQHHPEGVPIQPGQGMKGGALAGLLIISGNEIGQCPFVFCPGGMNEHSAGFVHSQQPFILVHNGEFPILGGVFRRFLIQPDGDDIPGFHGEIGALGNSVDQESLFPFQSVYQRGGELQVVAEKGGELPFPLGGQV